MIAGIVSLVQIQQRNKGRVRFLFTTFLDGVSLWKGGGEGWLHEQKVISKPVL